MATFIYKAKKGTTETVTGQITARNQDEAIELINQLGLLPISVTSQSDNDIVADPQIVRKIKRKEIYIFNRQLANLLKSGVSLLKALTIIEEQTPNPILKKVIGAINDGITNGRSFSECLSDYPLLFPPLYVTMITAGEEGSHLQEVLLKIADYQFKQEQMRSKVTTALAYPLFMGVMGILSMYFILAFVLPKMTGLFESLGSSLPLITVWLINVSRVFSKYGWAVLVTMAFLGISFWRWQKSPSGRLALSRAVLSMPLFGEILLKSELSRFCRTIVLLLKGGVSLVSALKITIPMMSNESIKINLSKCRDSLLLGGSFGEEIKKAKEIPPLMGHLISVGEESGNLEGILGEIADTYEEETDEKIKILTTLLEPTMILVVGLGIGFIVFAILLPIFQIDVLAR
ncbi:MAG: type II secretion system F family protein [Candidatus Omnitrophica bacterium]|nr:type II secretion system F family protein [Candidatus Omnitrophota bacterium]